MRKVKLLIFVLLCFFIFQFKTQALDNGAYIIRSSINNNMVLDVTGGSTSNGTNIQLFQYNGTKAQKWQITGLNNGYYKISSFLDLGKVLDVAGAGKLNGTNLQLHQDNSTNAQEWIIKEAYNGYYYIISRCNGLYLDVDSSKMINGTNIQLWKGYQNPAQTFKLDRAYESEKIIKDGSYIIHSSIDNNMVLDVAGGLTGNGTNVQLYQSNGSRRQKWEIKYLDNGYYKISSFLDFNKVLDVAGAKTENGTNLQLNDSNGTNAQEWMIRDAGNGYYYIISNCNGLYLDVDSSKMKNETNIQLWKGYQNPAQKFKLEKFYESKKNLDDGIYTIHSSINANMVLDITGGKTENGTNIQLFQSNGTKAQQWDVTYLENGYYRISSIANLNKSFDVVSSGQKNGTNLQLYSNSNTKAQEWIIKEAGNGYYYIISNCNGLYLDVDSSRMKNGTNIQLWQELQNPAQKFRFERMYESERTVPNGTYIIRSSINNNMVLDVANGKIENGTNIQLFQSNDTKAQKWQITYLKNGYYKISSLLDSNMVLDVTDSGKVNGTNLQLYSTSDTKAQEWIIRETEDGNYYIMSKCNGLYLDVDSSKMENGTNIQLWKGLQNKSQKFKLERVYHGEKTIDDGIYTIRSSINSSMVLDVAGGINNNGTNIQLYQTNGARGQKWKITYLGNGYYSIDSLLDLTKTLDVAAAGKKNGTNLQLHEKNYSRAQEWIIKEAEDGNYYIMSNCNGLYLDVDSSKMENRTNIQLWQELNNPAQTFKIIKSEEKNRVIDVSYHQGDIDWNKVANSGIYGVMLRIGYWETEDERFGEYIKEVKRLGIPYGIYIFSYANTINGANTEANFTNRIMSKYNLNPTLGIYYDLEDWYLSSDNTSHTLSKGQYDDIARTYINNVSSYVGSKYKVKIYADLNHVNNRFGDYAKGESDWIAHYNASSCGYKGPHSLWQYTSEATLDGIRGFVDMNYLY